MTKGAYQTRIPLSEGQLKRKDEITTVSESFNRMADAVESHINAVTAVADERRMLIGALTHEMKTPMTAIIGYAELLERAKLSEKQSEEAVSFIHREAQRLERLTQKMMQLITLTDGEDISLQDISARQLFDMAEETLRTIATRHDATLQFTENGERFAADPDLIIGVLTNLVDNSYSAGAKHVTTKKLAMFGIDTIGDVANTDPAFLKQILGVNGLSLSGVSRASKLGFRPVFDCRIL